MTGQVTVHHGDSRDVLKGMADASVDACVCDPPYALTVGKKGGSGVASINTSTPAGRAAIGVGNGPGGFMGQKWDTGEAAHSVEFWAEVFRVLKPGAHVVAFSGTRTQHRQVCAIEDAGFEIRDQLAWAYGSGFPKSSNQSGDWEGWGSALKPAWEPICLARKPLIGTIAANLGKHGTGALNIDASRIETDDALGGGAETATRPDQKGNEGWTRPWMEDEGARAAHAGRVRENVVKAQALGRWPANIVHDGSDEVLSAFPDAAGQQGVVKGTEPSSPFANVYGDMPNRAGRAEPRGDSGSAARFFYTAKADAEDRLGSKHPTVKPVDLMAWLCRLVTPPGGVVLDPFAGTGTTGVAALREGFDCILIEREEAYVADIHRRLAWARGEGRLTAQEMSRAAPKPVEDLPLFGGEAA